MTGITPQFSEDIERWSAIGLADFSAVQALIPDHPVLTIHIDPAGSSLASADLTLTGKESEESVVEQIFKLIS